MGLARAVAKIGIGARRHVVPEVLICADSLIPSVFAKARHSVSGPEAIRFPHAPPLPARAGPAMTLETSEGCPARG